MKEKTKIEMEWEPVKYCQGSENLGKALAQQIVNKMPFEDAMPVKRFVISTRYNIEEVAWFDVLAKRLDISRSAAVNEITKAGLQYILSEIGPEEKNRIMQTEWVEIYNALDGQEVE